MYRDRLLSTGKLGLKVMQAMKNWYQEHPHLFHKRPYDRPGCDSVDASLDHSQKEEQYRLWLSDPLALYGVENAKLAPGYRSPAAQTSRK